MSAKLFLFSVLIFSTLSAYAGVDTSAFFHFNLKNGLPTNNVYSTIQDKMGYTWLATDNGLVKYNGYTFEVYNTDNGGLPTNDVYEMYEDRRGRIWIKTYGHGFGYIQNGKYKSINYDAGERVVTPNFISEAGALLYFCTPNKGGYDIVVVDDDVIKVFPLRFNTFKDQGLDTIYNMYLRNDFDIGIWGSNLRLFRLVSSASGGLQDMGEYPAEYRYSYMHRMGLNFEGKAYLYYSGGHKVFYFDFETFEYKEKDISEWGANTAERIIVISPNYIKNSFLKYSTVLTNTHVYEFGDEMEFVSRQPITDIIPSSQQLVYRIKDNRQNYWYSTNGDGLWMKPADYNFFSGRTKNANLHKSKYLGSSGKSSFWLNSIKQELCELRSGAIVRKVLFKKGIEIRSISGNDSLAYISSSDGIFRYSMSTGKMYNLYERYQVKESVFGYEKDHKGGELALRIFRRIQPVGDNIYGVSSVGFAKAAITDSGIQVSRSDPERFVDCFYDQTAGKVYAYSGRRILIEDISDGSYEVIDYEDLVKMGVGNISRMAKGPHNSLIILDESALFLFNVDSRKISKVEVPFSLSSAQFRVVGQELMIAGKFGIAYAPVTNDSTVENFKVVPNSGMLHYNKVEDLIADGEGRVIVRDDMEWYSFSIDSLKKYAVSVNDQNGFFSLSTVSPLQRLARNNDTLRIAPNEVFLKLDAINYSGKGVVKYNYRFEGNTNWEVSTSGEIFLAGFDADKFHKIECKLKDDLWESNVYTFYIYRVPLWWQTSTWRTIFWVTGVVLFLALVLLTIAITRYYVAKKNERKRALTDLELQAIHSQINPHFIFNTLGTALFYINKKRFDDAYTHVTKFSQLLRSYLKSSQDRYVILEEEIKMLRNYIELQQLRFEEKFQYKVEIDNKLPINNIRIPSLLLQPLVENAINHGLFHRENGGILLLKFEQGSDSTVLVCTIDDNGVGREAARKINESTSNRESYGTTLTNQLLEVFKQYEKLDIKLDYTDKKLPETGTVVTLTLKNIKYVA